MTDSDPRYSLVAGEGDGAILGVAAGDTAGGAWQLGYSAVTEQVTVIAYQLIELGSLDEAALVRALLELDGSGDEEPVYRMETPEFRAWLDATASGRPTPRDTPSVDGGARAVPLGVAFRRAPDTLRDQALSLGRLFHAEPYSILTGVLSAAAVAASCFGQSGRDLIAGVIEVVEPAAVEAGLDKGQQSLVVGTLRSLLGRVGTVDGEEALSAAAGGGAPSPWGLAAAGLLLAAPVVERSHLPVEQAARIGGSPLAALVGGIVGARVGIRGWPWAFANDTWFAEIGRRLARGPNEVGDLPIPYAVEQHLISGERQGLY